MSSVEARSKLLRELLERGVEEPNDFVIAAIVGEELRCSLSVAEADPSIANAQSVLADYDGWLATLRESARSASRAQLAPEGLNHDLEVALERLSAFADLGAEDRQEAEAAQIVQSINEVLEVARAARAAGALSLEELDELQETARERAKVLGPRLPDCWQVAENLSLDHGVDPQYPNLYDWLEVLAYLAPSRLAAEREVARASLVSEIVTAMEEAAPTVDASRASDAGQVIPFPCVRSLQENLDLAAADDSMIDEDIGWDQAPIALQDDIELRLAEVEHGDGSLIAIRLSLVPTSRESLAEPDSVQVFDSDGRSVRPAARESQPLIWLGIFAVSGRVRLRLPRVGGGLERVIDVVRPMDPAPR